MSENAKKWNSGGLAGDYASLRKELEEKERALTAANERARVAEESSDRANKMLLNEQVRRMEAEQAASRSKGEGL